MQYNPTTISSVKKPWKRTFKRPLGFTLIEIIVGMVALSISLSLITQLIIPTEEQSADQIHQIKAAELGQSLMDEILAKSFDEKSDRAGGRFRCDEDQGDANLTVDAHEECSNTLGFDTGEEEAANPLKGDRNKFDDVDDYHNYSSKNNSTNSAIDSGYDSFVVDVQVTYDIKLDLIGGNKRLAKRITVTVTTPLGTAMEFTAFRANF